MKKSKVFSLFVLNTLLVTTTTINTNNLVSFSVETSPETEVKTSEESYNPEEPTAAVDNIATVEQTICHSCEVWSDSDYLGTVIGYLSYGETVNVFYSADGWTKLDYNGQVAYVKSDFVEGPRVFDEYLLAQICFAETGGVSWDEMLKVGQVVLNRLSSSYWEFAECNSIYDVVTQDGQYPETWEKIQKGIEPSEEALEVARGLLNGSLSSGLSENILWQTGFIPDWNVKVVLQTEWHYYSVLRTD